jgi:hypothetical protein
MKWEFLLTWACSVEARGPVSNQYLPLESRVSIERAAILWRACLFALRKPDVLRVLLSRT